MANTSNLLIIGGGVIGLSIARELHKRGVGRVTLLDKGVVGQESSWAAAGILGPQADTDDGGEMLRFCLESRAAYPQFAADLVAETGIDVELDRSGTLHAAFTGAESAVLRERVRWQNAAGLRAEVLSAHETRRAEPFISPDVFESVLFPDDWQVENRKLLAALRKYAELNGIAIIESTPVSELITEGSRVVGVKTPDGAIRADKTVLATGAWTSLIKIGARPLPIVVEPNRGQMICYRSAKRIFERVIYSSAGYLVPRVDGRVLVGATSDDVGFDRSMTDDGIESLRVAAHKMAPALASLAIVDKWAGLRPRSADKLPVLGTIAGLDGLTIATAHFRNGILLAPLTAQIMADKIVNGRGCGYLDTYSPDRFRIEGVGSAG